MKKFLLTCFGIVSVCSIYFLTNSSAAASPAPVAVPVTEYHDYCNPNFGSNYPGPVSNCAWQTRLDCALEARHEFDLDRASLIAEGCQNATDVYNRGIASYDLIRAEFEACLANGGGEACNAAFQAAHVAIQEAANYELATIDHNFDYMIAAALWRAQNMMDKCCIPRPPQW